MIARERLGTAAIVGRSARPVSEGVAWGPLAAVLAILPVAALTELLLIRTFYRVGIHIPREGSFRSVYGVLTHVGSFALNLSSVLVLAALTLLAWRAWAASRHPASMALGAVAALGVLLPLAGVRELGPTARLAFVLGVAAVMRPALARADGIHRFALLGAAAVALVSSYAGFATDAGLLAPSAAEPGGAVAAQLVAEALAVVTAFVLLASAVRSDGLRVRDAVLGAVPAASLLGAWVVNGAITGILVIWTAGLRMYLPVWVYVAALWAFGAAAAVWHRRQPWRAAGVVLLLVAGVSLGTTYQQALALVGLVLLSDGVAVGGLPGVPRPGPIGVGPRLGARSLELARAARDEGP